VLIFRTTDDLSCTDGYFSSKTNETKQKGEAIQWLRVLLAVPVCLGQVFLLKGLFKVWSL
jgi:hypothetical protein